MSGAAAGAPMMRGQVKEPEAQETRIYDTFLRSFRDRTLQ